MCFKSLMSKFRAVRSSRMFDFQIKCNDRKSGSFMKTWEGYISRPEVHVYFQGVQELRFNGKWYDLTHCYWHVIFLQVNSQSILSLHSMSSCLKLSSHGHVQAHFCAGNVMYGRPSLSCGANVAGTNPNLLYLTYIYLTTYTSAMSWFMNLKL